MLSENIYTECVSESLTISKTTDIMQTQSNKLHCIKWLFSLYSFWIYSNWWSEVYSVHFEECVLKFKDQKICYRWKVSCE